MDDRTPVLIGAGQFTYRGEPGASPSPTALLKIAAERAALDAGLKPEALAGIDTLAVVGFTIDAPGGGRLVPHSTNPPASLAKRLGADPAYAIEFARQMKAAGSDLGHAVKTTVFLKSMDSFAAMNEVYGLPEYFGSSTPARSTVEVARLPRDVMVEIEVVALA